ncbi:MAG: N-acyl homoserine lactone synthase [Thermoplasmatales archaeon B_DKE]|nr:MAG: N-acyl homoserine lactone synthase [Thermoplasmatales archaeon B_DKE]
MTNPKRALILGDGAAGTILSNKLRLLTNKEELEIVVIGNSRQHYFKPDGIQIPFSLKPYRKSVKNPAFLFNSGINYIRDEVIRIDIAQRFVTVKSGKSYDYDYLIIATGNRFTPEDVPGYEGEAKHFYDLQPTLALKEDLARFNGGDIVVGQSSIPIQCPPAPYEFTFLLDQYLRERGIRDKTNIHYIYPLNRVFTMSTVAKFIDELFEEKGIMTHTLFNVDNIDSKNKRVNSIEGESVNYDMLILVPPHRGQKVITESGLADELGYVNVDRHRLTYAGNDDVFVIGDATNLPVSKAGAAAHFQSGYLSHHIASDIGGAAYEEQYNGECACTTVTGKDNAITLFFSYDRPPRSNFHSKSDFLLKWTSADTYFSGMVRGIM